MGKKLRQQRRGKGSNVYRKLPGTFDAMVNYGSNPNAAVGEVASIFNHTGHSAPLMEIIYEDFSKGYLIAPEGIKIGDKVYVSSQNPNYSLGSVVRLSDVPEGIPIYNIESNPGDGGKLIRAAGSFARISAREQGRITVQMPSKSSISLSGECRAQLGVISGGGLKDQPLLKAGKSHYINHTLNRLWPRNRGVKMNPVDHPFGGKQHHKGKSSETKRGASPGRKVGHIAARRIGRKKR
ncbi:MAG: ribosomal protein L2 [Candidatus Micrarchaeum acidiphilum ARMAN-2]|jgi:large subunit ribosomal protein L2|uniref:Ribosomal protein L2 n=1 Tax=Candidatus Micrarchaeum acidiphilum ARMAN-2 TaxID=425595 RepID=C7DIC5_MICA2|nr:MAG: ribosomal protein L2 [Candidatus Micrarchaeum acidiphilum ARMAN-2]